MAAQQIVQDHLARPLPVKLAVRVTSLWTRVHMSAERGAMIPFGVARKAGLLNHFGRGGHAQGLVGAVGPAKHGGGQVRAGQPYHLADGVDPGP